ncbi:MAG: hypothetical protein M1816_000291 [Peltula sp. TS41687]|nr:MAG: hypothetical protein M1816_000291 [Peltula sp. TS41687]
MTEAYMVHSDGTRAKASCRCGGRPRPQPTEVRPSNSSWERLRLLLRMPEKTGFELGRSKAGITKNFEEWAAQEREDLTVVAERSGAGDRAPFRYTSHGVWEAILERELKTVAAASYIDDEIAAQGAPVVVVAHIHRAAEETSVKENAASAMA